MAATAAHQFRLSERAPTQISVSVAPIYVIRGSMANGKRSTAISGPTVLNRSLVCRDDRCPSHNGSDEQIFGANEQILGQDQSD